jgi:hypothetical protein
MHFNATSLKAYKNHIPFNQAISPNVLGMYEILLFAAHFAV